jgi:hypothetical protein
MAARLAARIPESAPPEISIEELFELFITKNPAQVSAETIGRYREMNANLARILGGKRKPSEIDDAEALRLRDTACRRSIRATVRISGTARSRTSWRT